MRSLIIAGLFFVGAAASCSDQSPSDADLGPEMKKAKDLYKMYCASCHGNSGDLGLSGAWPLSESTLSDEEALDVITNGRNVMVGFKGILSEEDSKRIVQYIKTLRN